MVHEEVEGLLLPGTAGVLVPTKAAQQLDASPVAGGVMSTTRREGNSIRNVNSVLFAGKQGSENQVVKSLSPPVVAEVGHDIVHNINQQWDHPLLLVTVEHHVQQMSQHLNNKVHIWSYKTC